MALHRHRPEKSDAGVVPRYSSGSRPRRNTAPAGSAAVNFLTNARTMARRDQNRLRKRKPTVPLSNGMTLARIFPSACRGIGTPSSAATVGTTSQAVPDSAELPCAYKYGRSA